MKKRFQKIARYFSLDPGFSFSDLKGIYDARERFYHTLRHITDCLRFFDRVIGKIESPEEVELALWFHDIVYVPARNDNEERSSIFVQRLLPKDSSLTGRHIRDLILSTRHVKKPTMPDNCYIADIDLASGFSGTPSRFYTVALCNRKEYVLLSEEQFWAGRKKLLSEFLNKEHIYYTPYFRSYFEKETRENIAAFLDRFV